MEAQEIRYRVNKKVFRQASLYAMFLRNRNTFRVGIAIVLAVAFYTVLAVQGTFPLSYLPIYIAAAYLVWMLLLLGREEQRVLRYLKSDESLLGTEYVLRFDAGKLSVEIPEKKLRNTVALAKLASAIEISSVFMLCLSADQLYLVPTAAMTDEQRTALRGLLSSRLGERFYSSILAREKNRAAAPPPAAAWGVGFAVLYRTAVLHAAVALAAPRLRLQEAARGIDEGAGGGQKVALFLVDHAQRVDKVGGVEVEEEQLAAVRRVVDGGLIDEAEAVVFRRQVQRRGGVGGVERVFDGDMLPFEKVVDAHGEQDLRVEQDKALVLENGELRLPSRAAGLRKRLRGAVAAVADQEDLFVENGLSGQVVGRIEIGVHDGKIHRVVRHQTEHLARRAFEQLKMGLGVLLRKGGQDARQERAGAPVAHGDAERLAAAGVQTCEILQKLLIELRAVLEIVGVDLAGCGQRQRRLGAVEQADAEFLFQMDDVLAQVGLRDVQPLRGFRNAFLGRNGKKIFRIPVLYHPDHLVFLFDYSKKYDAVKHGIVKILYG